LSFNEFRKRTNEATYDWTVPTRLEAVWHSTKVFAHIALRFLKNLIRGPRRITPSKKELFANVIAEHRSPLWIDGNEDEFLLRCGKVQNLRVAVKNFNGVKVKAGQALSFWSQLGRPSSLQEPQPYISIGKL
jgi:vancomycin resistance protein YoaR